MIEVTCPKCKKKFICERPTERTNHTVTCPYCGTQCRINPQYIPSLKQSKFSLKRLLKNKYIVTAFICVLLVVIIVVANYKSNHSSNTNSDEIVLFATESPYEPEIAASPEPTIIPTQEPPIGTIGDFIVTINNSKIVRDTYDNTDVIIVTYSFTNNSENPASFLWNIDETLFQNGIEDINTTYIAGHDNEYDSTNASREIQPGVTLEVQRAYTLVDTVTDIDVEIKVSWDFDDAILRYTIPLNNRE